MDFHYYYIIQDVSGILIGALAFKMILLYLLEMRRKGISYRRMLCTFGNVMMLLSGVNLTVSSFGLKAWVISGVLIAIGFMFGKVAFKLQHS